MLTQHCQRWPGIISAAVFTDKSIPELEAALLELEQLDMHSELDSSHSRATNNTNTKSKYGKSFKCRPHQVVFSTLPLPVNAVNDAEAEAYYAYPVNALRNLAYSKIKTSHFMYVDIDFWVSDNLHDLLHSESIQHKFLKDDKLALVVPAFQMERNIKCQKEKKMLSISMQGTWWGTRLVRKILLVSGGKNKTIHNNNHKAQHLLLEQECRAETIPLVPHTFEAMAELVMTHQSATAFDPTNRGGHGSTSYPEWMRMEDGELRTIPCLKSNRYEPYVAARWCDAYPPYQPVFTGYGKNKMTQIMQMRRSGYLFRQLGGVFVCHYPHPPAASREAWNAGKQERKLYTNNRTVFEEMYMHHGTGTDGTDSKDFEWTQYKRGQVDKLFVEYKRWLDVTYTSPRFQARTPMCEDPSNDDAKLWLNAVDINRDRRRARNDERLQRKEGDSDTSSNYYQEDEDESEGGDRDEEEADDDDDETRTDDTDDGKQT
jgi:hypothetical protein